MLLGQGAVPFHHGMATTSEAEVAEMVTAGVHAFLHGYLPGRGLGFGSPASEASPNGLGGGQTE
jgi:hypothetical protein